MDASPADPTTSAPTPRSKRRTAMTIAMLVSLCAAAWLGVYLYSLPDTASRQQIPEGVLPSALLGDSATGSPDQDQDPAQPQTRLPIQTVRASGKAVFTDGRPAAGAEIRLMQEANEIGKTRCDDDGHYEFRSARRLHAIELLGRTALSAARLVANRDPESGMQDWPLPDLEIPLRRRLRLEVRLDPTFAGDLTRVLVVAEVQGPMRGSFALRTSISKVVFPGTTLEPGQVVSRDVVILAAPDMQLRWTIQPEWPITGAAARIDPLVVDPLQPTDYQTCRFDLSAQQLLWGKVVDAKGLPVPQVIVQYRVTRETGGAYASASVRSDGLGNFFFARDPRAYGWVRAQIDRTYSEKIAFDPGVREVRLVVPARPALRVLTSNGTAVEQCAFLSHPRSGRQQNRPVDASYGMSMRDCPDGRIYLTSAESRWMRGERRFVWIPGVGEFVHRIERDVILGEDDAPYTILLPESPTTSRIEVVGAAELRTKEPRHEVSIHLTEIGTDTAAGEASETERRPLQYSLSLHDRQTAAVFEEIQWGTYRYEAKLGRSTIDKGEVRVVPGETARLELPQVPR